MASKTGNGLGNTLSQFPSVATLVLNERACNLSPTEKISFSANIQQTSAKFSAQKGHRTAKNQNDFKKKKICLMLQHKLCRETLRM